MFKIPAHMITAILFATLATQLHTNYGDSKLKADELAPTQSPTKKKYMNKITGEFDVKIIPADTGDSQMGMMLLDKTYRGQLQGTGKGRMLTGMTSIKDSAGYVAIERIEGELNGKKGSFLIQHSGTMAKGTQSLTIGVIPDSGTGELVGIEGEMQIRIEERKHFYDLQYSMPEAK
jgi:hypothetical protein